MEANATTPSRLESAPQGGARGRHEKVRRAPEQDFDYGRPFLLDMGRAAVIAEVLRELGHPRCTADMVAAELARPQRERSFIGHFAAEQLARARWQP